VLVQASKDDDADILTRAQFNGASPVLLPLGQEEGHQRSKEKEEEDVVLGPETGDGAAQKGEAAHGHCITAVVKQLAKRGGVLRAARLLAVQCVERLVAKGASSCMTRQANKQKGSNLNTATMVNTMQGTDSGVRKWGVSSATQAVATNMPTKPMSVITLGAMVRGKNSISQRQKGCIT
jgi:hypothetical protein